MHRDFLITLYIPIVQPEKGAPIISNYLFLQNALHVSGGLSVRHQKLKTAYTLTVYVKQLMLPAPIHLICTVFVLICTVVVLYCFVMCVCVCVGVFGNISTEL